MLAAKLNLAAAPVWRVLAREMHASWSDRCFVARRWTPGNDVPYRLRVPCGRPGL